MSRTGKGNLVNFSKSVGRVVKPSTTEAESYPVKQVQKQKAVAASRGNASQPDLLSLKKHKADDDGTSLLDCQLDDISDEDDRVEWLYQAIERTSDKHNYHGNPEFEDEDALFEVWEEIQSGGIINYNPPSLRGQGFQINSGLTKVLDPQKSGRTSTSKLIQTNQTTIGLDGTPVNTPNTREYSYAKLSRTDNTTIGLDGAHVNTLDCHEYGCLPTAKLTHTNKSTITLDGARLLPPSTNAAHPCTLNATTASHHQPSPHATATAANTAKPSATPPPKAPLQPKCPILSRARVEAIRQEAQAVQTAPRKVPAPSGSPQPPPAADIEIGEQGDNEGEAPPLEDSSHAGTPTEDNANGGDKRDVMLTKRQRSQLRTFGEEAVTCPFPELQGPPGADDQCYLDGWVTKFWANAHAKLRPNSPRLWLQDCHITYIHNQLSPTRNAMKKACNGLLSAYYSLHCSDSNHKVKAAKITHDEKWLSLNLANNNMQFQHAIIRDTIHNGFFQEPRHETSGAVYPDGSPPHHCLRLFNCKCIFFMSCVVV
ncbi:hypothetical protein FRC10_011700 [Ceratobasidium sp. 414]|nr:hypothetical protein FRC10_011700 [Ceratobasidium sp. 414]